MPNFVLVLALAAPLWLAGSASPARGQNTAPVRPVVVETQANPVGAGADRFIPPGGPVTADSPVAAAMPADPAYHGGVYTGALTVPPRGAMHKAYPPCTALLRDGCINSGRPSHRARKTAATL
jgi:hypothetical protein